MSGYRIRTSEPTTFATEYEKAIWDFQNPKDGIVTMFVRPPEVRTINFTPRAWQKRADLGITEILSRSDYAYLSAPTGSGKTGWMLNYGNSCGIKGTKVILCARDSLVRQHRETAIKMNFMAQSIIDNFPIYRAPNGDKWIITTVQAAARDADRMIAQEPSKFLCPFRGAFTSLRFQLNNEPVGLLFFDENHIFGSVAKNAEIGCSINKIKKAWAPSKWVNVSATGHVANQNLLGERIGHTFTYSMREAFKDGLIPEVRMHQVDCGVNLDVAAAAIGLGTTIDKFECDDAESATDFICDNAISVPSRKGTDEEQAQWTKLLSNNHKNRHRAMIDIYVAKHKGEQALFYCTSIKQAEKAVAYFHRRCPEIDAGTLHTRLSDYADQGTQGLNLDAEAYIRHFKNGNITVLFVVGMLQEGFDMPTLGLIFDCKFYREHHKQEMARLMQKVGRLFRKHPTSDAPKNYYMARDVLDVYGKVTTPSMPDLQGYDDAVNATNVEALRAGVESKFDVVKALWDEHDLNVAGTETETLKTTSLNSDFSLEENEQSVTTFVLNGLELVNTSGGVVTLSRTEGKEKYSQPKG